MRYLNSALFVAILSIAHLAVSGELGTISSEKARLLEHIQCHRQSKAPANNGLGSLWGCYNRAEDVKLWINGRANQRREIQNIKLAVIGWHGKKMDITGRIWAGILAEEYGGDRAEEIKRAFQECPAKHTYNTESLELSVKCSKGPKADEHLFIVYPK